MRHFLNNLEETEKVAHDFAQELKSKADTATVVGLYGELGAGKTFFAQCFAQPP